MKPINYQNLLENALRSVVKEALLYARANGLGDGTHFYITFRTRDPHVVIPDFLRMRYPDMMTVVLQYSYSNLNISDDEFGVTLTFDGRPFYVRIPFASLVEFKDPSVDFILQFNPQPGNDAGHNLELPLDESGQVAKQTGDDKRVVSLDEFRKKHSKKK